MKITLIYKCRNCGTTVHQDKETSEYPELYILKAGSRTPVDVDNSHPSGSVARFVGAHRCENTKLWGVLDLIAVME